MNKNESLPQEEEKMLFEIIAHENEPGYWERRFHDSPKREDRMLRAMIGHLSDAGLITTIWAEGLPNIMVQGDGYLYEKRIREQREEASNPSKFEMIMGDLLERTRITRPPSNVFIGGEPLSEKNRPSEVWVNDFEIFAKKYLCTHPLYSRIESSLSRRDLSTYNELRAILESISKDSDFIEEMRECEKVGAQVFLKTAHPYREYDVFLSHANDDKEDYVETLYSSLHKLGVSIFYDKNSLSWGDDWKAKILEGTRQAEFAIIVISENFFDREWTERELSEFLSQQNERGQKTILPILHNLTREELVQKYPRVSDIQYLCSSDYSTDEIALLFAKELIMRLKS